MTMTAQVQSLPRGRPFTAADLEVMPDDGHRYELIDGALIVTPAPVTLHQRASMRLSHVLYEACPDGLEVFSAPFDVFLGEDTVLQPDLLVARQSDLSEKNLPAAPVLAIEILSPSTRSIDLLVKKDLLERVGCPHYWAVDPDGVSITAWDLVDGVFRLDARAVRDERFEVESPFPVSFASDDLVGERKTGTSTNSSTER
jgi:Uma2 family endonuclease